MKEIVRFISNKSPVELVDISSSKMEKLESVYDNIIGLSSKNKSSNINYVSSHNSNNVLGKISGIFCMKNSSSANGRYYSDKFWKEVISSPVVKSRFKNSSMIGTLEHPISAGFNDSHSYHLMGGIMTAYHPLYGGFVTKDVKFDKDGYGIGEAYLLDTLVGNVILSYMISKDDSGNNLFSLYPSSRGYSDSSNYSSDGVDIMDPDDYDLVAWDLVFNPGVAKVKDDELRLDINEKLESMKSDNRYVFKKIMEKFESECKSNIRSKNSMYSKINKEVIKRMI